MSPTDTKAAVAKIMAGQSATLVVTPENAARARELHAKLPPSLRARLKILVEGVAS